LCGKEKLVKGTRLDSIGLRNVEQAKQCLRLIRDIADRGASSWDPRNVGYTLQELSQVLLERTGTEDRVFKPVSASELRDLNALYEELDFVDSCSQSMAVYDRH
jgi:hypothetical protein